MRAPSSLSSKAARPSRSSASEVSPAGCASIGRTGWRIWIAKRASPGAPSVSAAFATVALSPATMTARLTSTGVDARRARERVDEDPFERTLAKLAADEPHEKALFVRRRAREQLAELSPALFG
jgi:hypothetical protein